MIRGLFLSHSGLIGEQQQDISSRVLMTGPGGTAPLLALTAGMPTEKTNQTNWSWIEDSHIAGSQVVTTGGNAAATSLIVNSLGIWVANTVIINQDTGEHMLITAVTEATNTITVIRGIAGTTAATVSTNHVLQSIGTAHAEASAKPDAVAQQGEMLTNYVQIFKNAWAISGTARAVGFITGDKMAKNKNDCFYYHAEDIERAFWFGRSGIMVVGGKQLRLTNGVIAQIEGYGGLVTSANTGSSAGDLSFIDFLDFMRQIFDVKVKGMPNERIAYTSSYVMLQIHKMILQDSTYQISGGMTRYGFAVYDIVGLNGSLKMIVHPLMSESAKWRHEIYVIHPGLITKKVLRTTWSREYGGDSDGGVDAVEGYIGDELGLEVKGARAMGIYRNIQDGVASF